MSALEPDVPPAGEEIHIPEPSLMPVLLAVGITLAVVGITTFIELTVIGVVLSLAVLVRWLRGARVELEELPPEH
jgi:hypothetical protein